MGKGINPKNSGGGGGRRGEGVQRKIIHSQQKIGPGDVQRMSRGGRGVSKKYVQEEKRGKIWRDLSVWVNYSEHQKSKQYPRNSERMGGLNLYNIVGLRKYVRVIEPSTKLPPKREVIGTEKGGGTPRIARIVESLRRARKLRKQRESGQRAQNRALT